MPEPLTPEPQDNSTGASRKRLGPPPSLPPLGPVQVAQRPEPTPRTNSSRGIIALALGIFFGYLFLALIFTLFIGK